MFETLKIFTFNLRDLLWKERSMVKCPLVLKRRQFMSLFIDDDDQNVYSGLQDNHIDMYGSTIYY